MNLFLSQKPLVIGLDRFITGKSTKLLIVGLSGAGKTVLGKRLAMTYKAEYVNLDDFFFTHQQLKKENLQEYRAQQIAYENSQIESSGRKIIDGVAIMRMPEALVLDFPVIILRTSLIQSSWRGFKRNLKEKLTVKNPLLDSYSSLVKNLKKYGREVDAFTTKRLAIARDKGEKVTNSIDTI